MHACVMKKSFVLSLSLSASRTDSLSIYLYNTYSIFMCAYRDFSSNKNIFFYIYFGIFSGDLSSMRFQWISLFSLSCSSMFFFCCLFVHDCSCSTSLRTLSLQFSLLRFLHIFSCIPFLGISRIWTNCETQTKLNLPYDIKLSFFVENCKWITWKNLFPINRRCAGNIFPQNRERNMESDYLLLSSDGFYCLVMCYRTSFVFIIETKRIENIIFCSMNLCCVLSGFQMILWPDTNRIWYDIKKLVCSYRIC